MERIQQLISDNWSIRRHELSSLMAIVMPGIVSGNLDSVVAHLKQPRNIAQCYNPCLASSWDVDSADLPDDSVLVLKLRGALYSWDSIWVADKVKSAEANPRICGIVLLIDGPGGMVSHLDQAVAAVKKCSKPTATVVDGCMASAHFWLGSSADRTFIVSDLCEVGSVGIVVSHYSFRDYFKQNGIDFREIYPDSADLKNEEVRALLDKNDESLIKARAEKIHKIFSETVADNLGIKYDPALPLFRGRMFSGAEAVAEGYIDQFGDLQEAARWVLGIATSRKANSLIE